MAEPTNKSWTIPSTNPDAAKVQNEIIELIQDRGYKREAVFAVHLALAEALVNAVKHGNQNDDTKTVGIDFRIDDDGLVVEIEDQGPGFDPEALPDPTEEGNRHLPNGRGVMLMKAYMTEVRFNEAGNRVILIKRRDCDRPHAD